ncbi:unnamed protein product [Rotaria socialis]|uniref:Uncharacterized protein n=1 Tax=Rotaria socialis TaxID=392032 RepID=A0A820VQM2_9BILA|nr:unnamed protein product [Rotaria socialis]
MAPIPYIQKAMRLIIEQLYSVFFFSICSFGSYGSTEQHNTCMSKPLTYHDVERHFNYSSSNLFFLFGINIHRPFLNEFDQTHAEASIFIVVVCKKNSSNCITQGESLPTEYELEFSVDGVPYSDKNSQIDRRWHRTKAANYEFLYEPFNSHSWYDKPGNEQGSVWKNFIMNMDSYEQENIHAKWVTIETSVSLSHNQFYLDAKCINKNLITSRQFLLCTQDYVKYDTSIARFRIDIILCKFTAAYPDRCSYSLYEYILDEYLRLFIPIEGDNITFIGFIRLDNGSSSNEWRNHLKESYDKIYANELQNTYDYMIEIKSKVNSENSIIRSYQIITDQIHVCHLICRTNCVQKSPDHTDYFVSKSTVELILLCFQCSFTKTYNSLNHSILYFFSKLSRDSALLRIQITEELQHVSVNCYDAQNKQYSIEGKFHFRNQTNNSQEFFCSINPTIIYPYHEDIILECNHYYTRSDIIIWAITQLSKYEDQISLL